MAINIGSAVAYLELDTSKFSSGFASALKDLKVFEDRTASTETKLTTLSSSMRTIGSSLTKSVTLPLAGVGTAALKVGTDFEKAMSSVKAISGATGDEFEALEDKAISLGASTAFSATDVANAMTEMAKAGWSSQQILDGMQGVLDATAASGEELSTVATITADALTTFGLQASESTRVADLLTQAANAGTIGVYDLGESFKYIGPVANTMGFSIEDVTTAITALSTAGIKGSQAGTTLRTMFARMAKPTEQVADAMDALNITITDSEGNFKSMDQILREMRETFSMLTPEQQAFYATALAGQEGMSGLMALLGMTQEEYDAISDSMQNATGVAQETAAVMQDNLAGAVEQFGGALESAGIVIAQRLIPYIRGLAEWITNLVERFTSLDEEQQDLIVRIGLVVAAIGPLLLIFSKVVAGVSSAIKMFNTMKGAVVALQAPIQLLGTRMSTTLTGVPKLIFTVINAFSKLVTPITAAVAVIGILVAAFATLWKTNEEFRNNITNTWNQIVAMFDEAFSGIVDRINELGFDFESIVDVLGAIWKGFCDLLAPLFEGAFQAIAVILQGVLDVVTGFVDIFVGLFTGDINQVVQGFGEIFGGVFNTIIGLLGTFGSTLSNLVNVVFGWFGTSWQELWSGVQTFFVNAWNNIVAFFTETIPQFVQSIITWFENLPYNLGLIVGQMMGHVYNFATNLWNWITTDLPQIIANIINWFLQLPGNLWNIFTDIAAKVVAWGIHMLNNGINAAVNFVNGVLNWFRQLPGNIWNIIQQIPGIVSSIAWSLYEAGRNILNSLFDGIKAVGQGILDWFQNFVNDIGDFVQGILDGFNKVVSGSNKAKSAARSVNGSHAGGLSYVPFNGYVAELHEGERVLTKQENEAYNKNKGNSGGDTFNFYNTKPEPYEYYRQMKKAKRELQLGF